MLDIWFYALQNSWKKFVVLMLFFYWLDKNIYTDASGQLQLLM